MTRFRLVLVAAALAAIAFTSLHHGRKWTTYHDAKHGWTIDVPQSFDIRPEEDGARLVSPDSTMSLLVTGSARKTVAADTPLPLDPVALHVPKELAGRSDDVRVLTAYHGHRIYLVSVLRNGGDWQDVAFRMIRSLRFDR